MSFLRGLFGPPNVEELKAKGDVKGLIKALSYHKDHRVRQAAAEALDDLGWQPNHSEAGVRYWIERRQWDKCVEAGAAATKLLVNTLNSTDEDVRQAAAEALGRIGAPAVKPLSRALGNKEHQVWLAAVETLSKIGAPAVDELIWVVTNRHLKGNRRFGGTIALGQIAARLEDWQSVARLTGLFIGAIDDISHPTLPMAAVEALGGIGRRSTDDALRDRAVKELFRVLKITESHYSLMRRQAAIELGQIGAQSEDAALRARAVDSLIMALKDKESIIRRTAAAALERIGDERAVEPLVVVLQNDRDATARQYAAEALGHIGDPRAAEPLKAALNDPEEEVREAAEVALDKLH